MSAAKHSILAESAMSVRRSAGDLRRLRARFREYAGRPRPPLTWGAAALWLPGWRDRARDVRARAVRLAAAVFAGLPEAVDRLTRGLPRGGRMPGGTSKCAAVAQAALAPGEDTGMWKAAVAAEAEYLDCGLAQARELARRGDVPGGHQVLLDGLQRARLLCAEGMPGAEQLQMRWWEASLDLEESFCPRP